MTTLFRISTLVFVENNKNELLLIKRNKKPNAGCWSPIGGKLEMSAGESPHACALRELEEETGVNALASDIHLFGMITEKNYEGAGHWLMFLFHCLKPLDSTPEPIDEGRFGFFSRGAIDNLLIPDTDREALWGTYDNYRSGFVAMRADCSPGKKLEIIVEESF